MCADVTMRADVIQCALMVFNARWFYSIRADGIQCALMLFNVRWFYSIRADGIPGADPDSSNGSASTRQIFILRF